jgi:hypothetical protein
MRESRRQVEIKEGEASEGWAKCAEVETEKNAGIVVDLYDESLSPRHHGSKMRDVIGQGSCQARLKAPRCS